MTGDIQSLDLAIPDAVPRQAGFGRGQTRLAQTCSRQGLRRYSGRLLFPECTPQGATGGTTQCSTTDATHCGAGRAACRTANHGTGFAVALGGNGRSCAAADGATDYLTRTSADAFADGGSCSAAHGTSDCRLGSAVSRHSRARQQQTGADSDDEQCGVYGHRLIPGIPMGRTGLVGERLVPEK